MTKTQANEQGFVLVPREPTEAMLDAAHEIPIACFEDDVECFTTNREASSLYRAMLAAAPTVPAPAYGVKALGWSEPSRATNGYWVAKTEFGNYLAINYDGWYVTIEDAAWGKGFEWSSEDRQKDTLETAKAAAQADFERRVFSCLSSAPVEEADAKAIDELGTAAEWKAKREELLEWTGSAWLAGETDDDHRSELYGFLCGLIGWMRSAEEAARVLSPASTIPSEPEAKGEAGAGPVGDELREALYKLAYPHVGSANQARALVMDLMQFLARPAGAGPVGEAVAWLTEWQFKNTDPADITPSGGGYSIVRDAASAAEELTVLRTWYHVDWFRQTPLYTRPVDEPGEVARLTRERDEARKNFAFWEERENVALKRALTAEASLTETRERLETEIAGWETSGSHHNLEFAAGARFAAFRIRDALSTQESSAPEASR